MAEVAEWGGERGGFDDFEYTIEESKFGYDEKYDAARGKNTLRWLPVGTAVLEDGKTYPGSGQGWNLGKGWDPVDGGKRVAKEDGSDIKPMKNPFHYQSGMATFVRAAIDCGAGEVLNARCNGDPSNLINADIWVGLRFRLQRISQGTFKNAEGKDQEYSMLLPTEFLGEVGGPSTSGGATRATGDGGSLQSNTKNGSGSDQDLEELAKLSAEKTEFLTAAIKEFGKTIDEAEVIWDHAHA